LCCWLVFVVFLWCLFLGLWVVYFCAVDVLLL
jgi:hypothetical protein